jgi:hypothetical protein
LFFNAFFFFGIVIVEIWWRLRRSYNKKVICHRTDLKDIHYDYANMRSCKYFSENENIGLIEIIDAIKEAKKTMMT